MPFRLLGWGTGSVSNQAGINLGRDALSHSLFFPPQNGPRRTWKHDIASWAGRARHTLGRQLLANPGSEVTEAMSAMRFGQIGNLHSVFMVCNLDSCGVMPQS